ncbi:hypothetical protein B0T13DRAFT_138111 [Neurospora crassa]|nr:hypothetical protein B0T13DRAFT_138111 [Neurospora crassa]
MSPAPYIWVSRVSRREGPSEASAFALCSLVALRRSSSFIPLLYFHISASSNSHCQFPCFASNIGWDALSCSTATMAAKLEGGRVSQSHTHLKPFETPGCTTGRVHHVDVEDKDKHVLSKSRKLRLYVYSGEWYGAGRCGRRYGAVTSLNSLVPSSLFRLSPRTTTKQTQEIPIRGRVFLQKSAPKPGHDRDQVRCSSKLTVGLSSKRNPPLHST